MSNRISLPKQKSPIKAIRMMCIECMGGDTVRACADLIRDCASKHCPLHDFRFGRNPNKGYAKELKFAPLNGRGTLDAENLVNSVEE